MGYQVMICFPILPQIHNGINSNDCLHLYLQNIFTYFYFIFIVTCDTSMSGIVFLFHREGNWRPRGVVITCLRSEWVMAELRLELRLLALLQSSFLWLQLRGLFLCFLCSILVLLRQMDELLLPVLIMDMAYIPNGLVYTQWIYWTMSI